jgi:hypothetical protein
MHRAFLGTSRPRLATQRPFFAMRRPFVAHRHPKPANLTLVLTLPRQGRGHAVPFPEHRDALAAIPKEYRETRHVFGATSGAFAPLASREARRSDPSRSRPPLCVSAWLQKK